MKKFFSLFVGIIFTTILYSQNLDYMIKNQSPDDSFITTVNFGKDSKITKKKLEEYLNTNQAYFYQVFSDQVYGKTDFIWGVERELVYQFSFVKKQDQSNRQDYLANLKDRQRIEAEQQKERDRRNLALLIGGLKKGGELLYEGGKNLLSNLGSSSTSSGDYTYSNSCKIALIKWEDNSSSRSYNYAKYNVDSYSLTVKWEYKEDWKYYEITGDISGKFYPNDGEVKRSSFAGSTKIGTASTLKEGLELLIKDSGFCKK